MSFSASKKHSGARTSQQVAAPAVESASAPIREPSELETSGTLPHPYALPLSEPDAARIPSRIPRLADASKDLSQKWGIPDADQLLGSAGDRRVTRKAAKLTRSGAPMPEPVSLVYRGHDGMRIKDSRKEKQTDADTLTSNGEPAAPSAGAPVVEASVPGGEPVAFGTGAPTGTMDPGGELTAFCVGAPASENSQANGEPAVHNTGAPIEVTSRSAAETAAQAASSRPENSGVESPGEWQVAVVGPSSRPSSPKVLNIARRFFPSWFDLSEKEDVDPYGPIPIEWLLRPGSTSPRLPNIKIETSLVNDFWREFNSNNEERDLQRAIQASISTAVEEREKRERQPKGLSAMAMLIELHSGDEEPDVEDPAGPANEVPEAPAGHDGRYSSKQKGKAVPRSKDQREFLSQYISGSRAARDKSKSVPLSGKGKEKAKAPQGPAQFKREPSLVPEGGWFRASTTAGGRGPPRGPPSSSSSSSEPDSSSSDSSSEDEGSSSGSNSSSSSDHGHRGKTSHEKRHRDKQKRDAKRIRKALAGVKVKPP